MPQSKICGLSPPPPSVTLFGRASRPATIQLPRTPTLRTCTASIAALPPSAAAPSFESSAAPPQCSEVEEDDDDSDAVLGRVPPSPPAPRAARGGRTMVGSAWPPASTAEEGAVETPAPRCRRSRRRRRAARLRDGRHGTDAQSRKISAAAELGGGGGSRPRPGRVARAVVRRSTAEDLAQRAHLGVHVAAVPVDRSTTFSPARREPAICSHKNSAAVAPSSSMADTRPNGGRADGGAQRKGLGSTTAGEVVQVTLLEAGELASTPASTLVVARPDDYYKDFVPFARSRSRSASASSTEASPGRPRPRAPRHPRSLRPLRTA